MQWREEYSVLIIHENIRGRENENLLTSTKGGKEGEGEGGGERER